MAIPVTQAAKRAGVTVATIRTWILTREAWEQSPARQRMEAR